MELWDAYTKDGEKTGQTLVRGEPIPAGLYHLVCEVLVRHRDGSYLAMKRWQGKEAFPGWWETTAGGSALQGEDMWQCVRRELQEETGLQCEKLTHIGCLVREDGDTMFHSFLAEVDCDKESVALREGETEDYRWLSEEAFVDFVNSGHMIPYQKRRLMPWLKAQGYLQEEKLTNAELTDMGICPTCYDRDHDHCIYGDPAEKMLYENDLFECMLIGAPRASGHTVIISKAHYKDMLDIPDELCRAVYVFAKRAMQVLKEVYGAESVYLCTMCDGPMNHFHVQLIPRYACEKRGSRNFVKPRTDYVKDPEKIRRIREELRRNEA